MKFIRKEFNTKDADGCEFKVLALYGDRLYDAEKHDFYRDCDFYAFNKTIHAKSLKEIKRLVALV